MSTMYRKSILVLALLAASIITVTAQAATTTTTFQVTTNVHAACSVSATSHSFADYDHTSATPLDAINQVTTTCTLGTPYDIGLGAGTGSGATVAARKMTAGTDTLIYSLYQDAARTTVWGETIGTNTVSGAASATFNNYTVYGRMPAGQDSPTGAYSDTITVTVTY